LRVGRSLLRTFAIKVRGKGGGKKGGRRLGEEKGGGDYGEVRSAQVMVFFIGVS